MRARVLLVAGLSMFVGACASSPTSSDDGSSGTDPGDGDGDGDGDGVGDGDGDGDGDGTTWDPLSLAQEVDGGELEASIADLADFGTRYTFSDGDDLARDYLVARLEAYGYDAELDPFVVQGEPVANVIARLPGSEQPDVVFLFSAHYDSISEQPNSLAPGADDNASGVAVVLEAARILRQAQFRYSLWFVMTAAEEQGSQGAEQIVGWLPQEGVELRAVMAPDMVGYWPQGNADALDILGDPTSEARVYEMAEVAEQLGVAHKTWIQHDYCYGDDHTIFQEAGYPAITPMDCVEAHNLPENGETLPHYHQSTDALATLHLPFTTQAARVMVATLATWAEVVD